MPMPSVPHLSQVPPGWRRYSWLTCCSRRLDIVAVSRRKRGFRLTQSHRAGSLNPADCRAKTRGRSRIFPTFLSGDHGAFRSRCDGGRQTPPCSSTS